MNLKSKVCVVAAAAVILAAGAVGAVGSTTASAQEPTRADAPNHKQERRTAFLNHLVQNLGITLDQLKQAVKNAELQTIDDLVSDGTLTADQGAKIKDKINSSDGPGLGRFLRGARERRGDKHERYGRLRAGIVKSAATAIGIGPGDLKQELKSGKSIAEVAAEHNVSLDAVKSQITSDAKGELDKLVHEGKISQERADKLLQKLTSKLDDILNKKKS